MFPRASIIMGFETMDLIAISSSQNTTDVETCQQKLSNLNITISSKLSDKV